MKKNVKLQLRKFLFFCQYYLFLAAVKVSPSFAWRFAQVWVANNLFPESANYIANIRKTNQANIRKTNQPSYKRKNKFVHPINWIKKIYFAVKNLFIKKKSAVDILAELKKMSPQEKNKWLIENKHALVETPIISQTFPSVINEPSIRADDFGKLNCPKNMKDVEVLKQKLSVNMDGKLDLSINKNVKSMVELIDFCKEKGIDFTKMTDSEKENAQVLLASEKEIAPLLEQIERPLTNPNDFDLKTETGRAAFHAALIGDQIKFLEEVERLLALLTPAEQELPSEKV